MTGPSLTRIDVVVDALIDLLVSATGLQVADGPHIGEVMAEAICVGFSQGPDLPGYETRVARQDGMGRPRMLEEFTVRMFMTISSGEDDMATLRARAAALLGLIDTALRDAHHNAGVWDRASIGPSVEWVPVFDATGGLCNVFFTVVGASLL